LVEIKFSVITDDPDGADILSPLLEEYEAQHPVRVRVHTMTWEQAWPNLLQFALYGKGPDVSHIGSTWSNSLVMMNALRPFTPHEVAALGGPNAFVASIWQGDGQVWTIPWTAYTHVVCYRRDLLKRAGVDEQTAFETAEAMVETFRRIKSAGIRIPWIISTDPCPDVLHIAANWVWGAGGDFVSDDGKHTLFNQPEALTGLKAYFELYHYLPPVARNLDSDQRFRLFAGGLAAATIIGSIGISASRFHEMAVGVREQLSTAVVPGIPWVGGDNLVIWRYTQGYPDREHAAMSLVSFLSSRRAQMRHYHATGALPARFDALSELAFEPGALAQTYERSFRTGRAYKAISMWTSVEHQLSQALDQVAADVMVNPAADIDSILHEHLDPLARRLDLMLNQ
jgi:multiple sugar transport system substrate-binding protein